MPGELETQGEQLRLPRTRNLVLAFTHKQCHETRRPALRTPPSTPDALADETSSCCLLAQRTLVKWESFLAGGSHATSILNDWAGRASMVLTTRNSHPEQQMLTPHPLPQARTKSMASTIFGSSPKASKIARVNQAPAGSNIFGGGSFAEESTKVCQHANHPLSPTLASCLFSQRLNSSLPRTLQRSACNTPPLRLPPTCASCRVAILLPIVSRPTQRRVTLPYHAPPCPPQPQPTKTRRARCSARGRPRRRPPRARGSRRAAATT